MLNSAILNFAEIAIWPELVKACPPLEKLLKSDYSKRLEGARRLSPLSRCCRVMGFDAAQAKRTPDGFVQG
ncbi:hypothetical protein [Halomicronema sp. CCY15110]|uniref:hypothetical protein n=1 Tax=Halomicronema sp. CCY15110 TaxID=2767773 RepID=UPI00194E7215|nr:hypothetical protein [Halomicronema sp. CCY15110]